MGELIDLGGHHQMTPVEALAVASREKWHHVMVIGFREGDEGVTVHHSEMSLAVALFILRLADAQTFDSALSAPADEGESVA